MKKLVLLALLVIVCGGIYLAMHSLMITSHFSTNGWESILYTPKNVFITSTWNSYSLMMNDKNYLINIKIPQKWKINGSVFYDETGNKIAEFLPGIVLLNEGQEYDQWKNEGNIEGYSKVLSVGKINIKNNKGLKKIEEVYTESGKWYPNIYLIEGKNKVIIISFYETNLNSDKRPMFDTIISTLKIE